jgi:rhodanese-related sulfurtransferase
MKSSSIFELSSIKVLAILALLLGAVAVLGDPFRGGVVTLDTRELARIVEGEVDHVTVQDLAERIVEGQADFRLLDLRDPGSYAEYHIPGAESVPIGQLPDYPLYKNEEIILYSGGGIHSAQAWFLLRAEGYPGVYMLLGGIGAWQDEVLFPTPPSAAGPEELAAFERARFVSQYFGGSPRTGGSAAEATPMEMPKVDLPASAPVVHKKKKKAKEGC